MFLDTSGLLAYLTADEAQHREAMVLFDVAAQRYTHSYIIAELVPLASKRRVRRDRILDFIETLHRDGSVEIEYVDRKRHLEAVEFLVRYGDKDWSLCDAVSFLMMRRLSLYDALTTDHHFEQAGFVHLLSH